MDSSLCVAITGLALADAVNVCAIAVLTMVLTTILIQNPSKRKKVLYAGLTFVLAVYLMYFFYGIILFQLFSSVTEKVNAVSPYVRNILIITIMIVGALNVKDYFMYRPGGLATEMPIFMRPQVKKIINKATSPKGSFVIGLLVTLFLLPCTIMPLITAMNKLVESGCGFVQSIPWLLYYNILFVLPMLVIVGLVYWGFAKVDEVSGWKERNIRLLHLIAGILLFGVGLALLSGWL
ncbi:MAG: hypothetical protein ABIB79_00750 [archaeon]